MELVRLVKSAGSIMLKPNAATRRVFAMPTKFSLMEFANALLDTEETYTDSANHLLPAQPTVSSTKLPDVVSVILVSFPEKANAFHRSLVFKTAPPKTVYASATKDLS